MAGVERHFQFNRPQHTNPEPRLLPDYPREPHYSGGKGPDPICPTRNPTEDPLLGQMTGRTVLVSGASHPWWHGRGVPDRDTSLCQPSRTRGSSGGGSCDFGADFGPRAVGSRHACRLEDRDSVETVVEVLHRVTTYLGSQGRATRSDQEWTSVRGLWVGWGPKGRKLGKCLGAGVQSNRSRSFPVPVT